MGFLRKIKEKAIRNFGGAVIKANTELSVKHIRKGKVLSEQKIKDKVVTTAFVNDLVAALIGTAGPYGTFNDYKWHASGVGTNAEDVGNTTMHTEVGDRVAGTQIEGDTPNVYKSVATITYGAGYTIREHGLFNADSVGTLMDRTRFSDVSVEEDDSIQYTFTIQFNAGG